MDKTLKWVMIFPIGHVDAYPYYIYISQVEFSATCLTRNKQQHYWFCVRRSLFICNSSRSYKIRITFVVAVLSYLEIVL